MPNLYLLLFQYFAHVLTTMECSRNSFCCKNAGVEGRSVKVATHFLSCHSSSARAEVGYVSCGYLSMVLRDNVHIAEMSFCTSGYKDICSCKEITPIG